jgi:serine/threonine-protein kinase
MALDTVTGSTRWSTNLGIEITADPTVAGTTVLIGTKDGVVFGLEAFTGEVLWEFKTAGRISGSPIVVGDTMYVVSSDGTLSAVTRAE